MDPEPLLETVVVLDVKTVPALTRYVRSRFRPKVQSNVLYIADVPHEQPIRDLIGRKRPPDLDVELFGIAERIDEAARVQ